MLSRRVRRTVHCRHAEIDQREIRYVERHEIIWHAFVLTEVTRWRETENLLKLPGAYTELRNASGLVSLTVTNTTWLLRMWRIFNDSRPI